MSKGKFFPNQILHAAFILFFVTIVSCKNNDTGNSTAKTTSDTSTVIAQDPAMNRDSGLSTTNATANNAIGSDSKMAPGVSKPDPAKKGLKGKVTISTAPVATGTMEADQSGVYTYVEVYPSFPGGSKGLQKYFDNNLVYPTAASNEGVEGKVNVMFTVDETGKLTDPHIMGDKPGYGLEDEALRVVKTMPAWIPGKLKGKNVKTKFTLPVSFQLY